VDWVFGRVSGLLDSRRNPGRIKRKFERHPL
jgi:hypothetical protein